MITIAIQILLKHTKEKKNNDKLILINQFEIEFKFYLTVRSCCGNESDILEQYVSVYNKLCGPKYHARYRTKFNYLEKQFPGLKIAMAI